MSITRRIFTILLGLPLAYLVLATSYSVFMRYWMEDPILWMEETSGLAMIWVVMVGAMCAERDGENLSIAFLTELMGEKTRLICSVVVSLFSIGLLLYIAYLGHSLANRVAFKLTGVLKISWYWIDIAVPVGMVGAAVFVAINMVKKIRGLDHQEHNNEGEAA
ncbi:TRAP transporter small permease [Cohaesibacter haloalkalitolerans]|uniref:TRAP transporter small permease n=1 Tax=Cohaesibacter haloalkalitolerans TaxID=1162980 RepID=UPI000E64682E|nr:TRAP transporter small permease [Cohaesibacter haloalkalitolerans]